MKVHPVWWNGTNVNDMDPGTNVGTHITALYGWDDRVTVRDVRETRAGQDGEYADNVFLGGRTITVEGTVYGDSWEDLQVRKRALAATFVPQSVESLLKVPLPDAAAPTAVYAETGMVDYERASARVIESIVFGDLHGPGAQSFQVVVRASDPRIYSDVLTTVDDTGLFGDALIAELNQGGSYDTPMEITLTGPTDNWSLSPALGDCVLTLASTDALDGEESLTINTADRSVQLAAAYYRSRLRRSDIVAGWRLNETSGTVADNVEGTAALDLTINGGVTLNQSGPGATIPAVTLNGSTGYLSHAYSASLNLTTFTFELWFKHTGGSGDQVIAQSMEAFPAKGWSLYLTDSGALLLTTDDGSGDGGGFGFVVSSDTWYHVAVVVTPSSCSLYVNGFLYNTLVQPYLPSASQGLTIGRKSSSSAGFFTGGIGPAFLYDTALTGDDILALFAATDGTTITNAYNMIEASTSRWGNLGAGAVNISAFSTGFTDDSALSIAYRDART
jgi:hypothetical protein